MEKFVCVCVCMCEREGEHMAWMGEQWMTYCVELWLKFILCDRSIELFFDSMEKLSLSVDLLEPQKCFREQLKSNYLHLKII